MRIGYIRGTTDEVIERQKTAIMGVGVDKIIIDRQIGSKQQSELSKMLQELGKGNTVVVESLLRLARNTRELMAAIRKLNQNKVNLISVNGGLDTSNEIGKRFMEIIAREAAFEQEFLKRRQLEGIQQAKDNGKYSGRKRIMPEEKLFEMVYMKWVAGEISSKGAMKILGLKPNTFYRRIKEYRENNSIIDFGI